VRAIHAPPYGSACGLLVECVSSPNKQKYPCAASLRKQNSPFVMLLESSRCPFSFWLVRGVGSGAVCCQRCFLSPLFSLQSQKNHDDYSKLQSCPLIYWYFNFNPIFFVLSPFVKFQFVFNFIIQFQSVICYFFF